MKSGILILLGCCMLPVHADKAHPSSVTDAANAPEVTEALETLGVLFYTPVERQRISLARQQASTRRLPAAQRHRLHGVMQSSQGHTLLWIDQRPQLLPNSKLRPDHAIALHGQLWRVGEMLELSAAQSLPGQPLPAIHHQPRPEPQVTEPALVFRKH